MIKKQFTLYLENKPGVLARLTRRLAQSGVNIEGISVAAATDVALVQVVASNAAIMRRVLKSMKTPFTVQEVAVILLTNTPGALAKVLTRLAEDHININYVYATASDVATGGDSYAIISAPDLKKVEESWAQG
jgi:hypothetical protein